ncbi:hypothetical protein ACOYR1_09350 [Thalassotalea piscium]
MDNEAGNQICLIGHRKVVKQLGPYQTEERVISKSSKESWNGEFYVSFGHDKERHWADARKYGYISAGHNRWY